MAKKLKNKIEDVCGLSTLDRDSRLEKAKQILADTEWKTKICNSLVGLSFKELEKTLKAIVNEREVREEAIEKKVASGKMPYKGKVASTSTKLPPRSIEEILRQVYDRRANLCDEVDESAESEAF